MGKGQTSGSKDDAGAEAGVDRATAELAAEVGEDPAGVESAVREGGSTVAPRGGAAEENGNVEAGLRRSIETVTVLFPFRMSKVFGDRWRTRNGPSYGGTKGRRTASTRRKTWEDLAKAGSTREDWDPWCRTGIGTEAPKTEWRRLQKSWAEGMGSEHDNMSPGRRREDP